jgi:hypothetical protein
MPSLKKLTRDQLNDKAKRLGIADAVGMSNRAAVIEAIEAAKTVARPDARVVSVFANGQRVMIEMHVDRATAEFGDLAGAGGSEVVDAIKGELAEIRKRNAEVADSALAAAAVRMAFELDHPYNSATAKANCMSELHKAMDRLLELAPREEQAKGRLDELKARRKKAARRAAA